MINILGRIPEDQRLKVVIASALIVFIAITSLFVFFSTRNKFGNEIPVVNYDAYAKDLPQIRREGINNSLYKAVELNLIKDEKIITSPGTIREGTVYKSHDKTTNVTSGSFIVDLKGIRQSYRVTYDWSSDENNPNVSGYVVTVSCLRNASEIVYKDFANCRDSTEEAGVPLQYSLPHVDIGGPFKIVYVSKGDHGEARLAISNSTPNGRQNALKWLRIKGIDPTDVFIDYFGYNNPFAKRSRDF